MDTILQDLRCSARSLLRSPGLTITALITLALGIGANTALFSLINGALWSPPPGVRDVDQLVWVNHTSTRMGGYSGGFSTQAFDAYRARNDVFQDLAAFVGTAAAISGSGAEPARVNAELVSANYFSVLRMPLAVGRGFLPEEDRTPGTHPVAIISHDLWVGRFGSDPAIMGTAAKVNGTAFTVVGVAAPGFRGLAGIEDPADLWMPLAMSREAMPAAAEYLARPHSEMLRGVGRLAPEVSPERVAQALAPITARLEPDGPDATADVLPAVTPLRGAVGPGGGGSALSMLALAMGVTLAILLIACGNVANLLLARAAGRRREIAIRSAIGASRWRIVRQLLVESLTLSLGGGVLGFLLAIWMIALFTTVVPLPFPIPVALDRTALWVTLGLAIATGLVFGLAPAMRASRPELTRELKEGAGSGRGGARVQRALVAAQLALCFMLLVGAGMLLRALREQMLADGALPARDQVLALSFDLMVQGYPEEARRNIQLRMLEEARALPGVATSSMTSLVPYEGGAIGRGLTIQRQDPGVATARTSESYLHHNVWPDFFATLGLPMLRGRDFTVDDRKGSAPVAIVNEAAAERYWPRGEAVGSLIRTGADTSTWITVVGVVGNGRMGLNGRDGPVIYRSELQVGALMSKSTLLVRTSGNARSLIGPLRERLREVNPDLPVFDVRTLGQVIDQRHLAGQIGSGLLAIFGALALGLAVIGLHGVIAFAVVQRTREVGVRIALGATRRDVLSLFSRDALKMACTGLAAGLVLALGAGRILSHVAEGLKPTDPVATAAVALLLLAVTLLAAYLPARRATRVDPMVALRQD